MPPASLGFASQTTEQHFKTKPNILLKRFKMKYTYKVYESWLYKGNMRAQVFACDQRQIDTTFVF